MKNGSRTGEWRYELEDIEIMALDEERLENNVGYGNIKERAPEGALWFLVFNFEILNCLIGFTNIQNSFRFKTIFPISIFVNG